ncbi:hypothetical protein ACKKBG_A24010 [Auxenochlorella protothecoides x Auxenochlorella symbiontica]
MPKKSTKSKSKRTTLKHKYKVLRKVKEHHRKKRKEAKKLGLKKREPKDPGIPNAWPYKQELIQQLTAQKERAAARMRKTKEEHFKREQQATDLRPAASLANVSQAAQERADVFDGALHGQDGVTATQDYSRRAYYKDFVKVVEAADVILEVIDARDPEGGRCRDVERFVRKLDPKKKVILLLNKIDLVPKEALAAWLQYLRQELPTIPFKSSTQQQAKNLGQKQLHKDGTANPKVSESLGADSLLQLLKNYARNAGLKTALTVGVVGLPNVGKSSVINSLKRSRVAQVGNTPGVTRSVQSIHLDKQITLLDSPGVVFADPGSDGVAAAALRNCIKIEQLDDPILPVMELVRRCPAKQLMVLYKAPAFKTAEEFLVHLATSRGKLKKGGTVDMEAAARILLQDWNDGRIPYHTLPPKRASTTVTGSAAIVTEWGPMFEAGSVQEEALIGALPVTAGGGFVVDTLGEVGFDPEAPELQDEEDVDMEDEEGDSVISSDSDSSGDDMDIPSSSKSGLTDAQNAQLYNNPGQYNPHAARAARKQKKRLSRSAEDDSDFDFEEDYSE